MDLSKVGERFLSSLRSAMSLEILPFHSDRPNVPARAATAAVIARALASLPPHQRLNLPSSEGFVSIYGITHHGETVEELEEDFYEEVLDPILHMLQHIPADDTDPSYVEKKAALRLAQLDAIAERLSRHVMGHHQQMVKGMQLVMEVEHDLKVANVICMVQDSLLEYGLENVSEIFIEGLSRVKRCTNEGRALMALDLQVLINGLHHLVSLNVKPKLQTVEAFIKAYYLPETEYIHWARSHPEYSKIQITSLVNLVATMNNWKRKTRLDVLEKIETGCL